MKLQRASHRHLKLTGPKLLLYYCKTCHKLKLIIIDCPIRRFFFLCESFLCCILFFYFLLLQLQFSATDADNTSTDGRVRYFFKSGNETGHFHLNEDNGTLTIIKPLDYETQTQFILKIVALDSPTEGEPFQDEVQLIINVQDVDDTCPKLSQNITSEMITIYENETFILNYTIFDPDTNKTSLSVIENTELSNHSAIRVNYGMTNITGKLWIKSMSIFEFKQKSF